MIKTLDDVIHNVVYNDDIQSLLKNPDLTHQYNEIVQFQIDECKKNGTSIDREGFQIGEPYDGDIEHAPILFLSSNPGFDFDEVSPRYAPNNDTIFDPSDGHTMSFSEIKTFFESRIVGNNLCIPLKNATTKSVSYWKEIMNKTQQLLPVPINVQQSAQIMRYAVCMEIVPFKSRMAAGVTPNLLNKCWDDFTQHLLAHSAAEVIVIVGVTALKTFCGKKFGNGTQQETALRSHNTIIAEFGNKSRNIFWAERKPFPQIGELKDWDDGYFANAAPNTLALLQAAVASSPLVRKAIANGGILQN